MLVKLLHPKFWADHGHWAYENHFPNGNKNWGDIEFEFNASSKRTADFVVVHDNLDYSMNLEALGGGFILVTGEEESMHPSYPQGFLEQFDCIITSRQDIRHPNVIKTFYLHPWRIKRTYDQLARQINLEKTLNLSAIISHLAGTPMQQMRLQLMKELKAEYGQDFHWFSKGGEAFINDKWDGLAPYKYSVAIENSVHENYFTEKISDCFLALTVPLYAGCPNINEFFDDRSFLTLESLKFNDVTTLIDGAIKEGFYSKAIPYLKDSKSLVLNKYQLLAALRNILLSYDRSAMKVKKKLEPQAFFIKSENGLSKLINRFLRR